MSKPSGPGGGFWRDDKGSATIETVIWIPIFVWFLALIVNVSMIMFQKNQAYRVVQNANRIVSTGYMQTEEEVEDYIRERIDDYAPGATINTTIDGNTVTSVVAYQVSNLLLPKGMVDMANIWINISSEHFMEY